MKGRFFIVAAGATLLAMASFAIINFFRAFTWRKDPPVDFSDHFGTSGVAVDSAPSATNTPAHMIPSVAIHEPAPVLHSGELTHVTSPIDPSEARRQPMVLASEELLSRDWASEEDDKAWAHL